MTSLNVLCSFALFNTPREVALVSGVASECRVLIDSGAFSNYSIGKRTAKGLRFSRHPVSLDAYMKACAIWDGRVWQYIALV